MLHYVAHTTVERPQRWVLFLHGILGQGTNWTSFARALVRELPEWGAITVDLRMHGRSQGLPPPHHLRACANDLSELDAHLGNVFEAVCGHSFGAKVALLFAEKRRQSGRPVDQVWVLDADPGCHIQEHDSAARTGSVQRVLAALDDLPKAIASRPEFAERLSEHGLDAKVIAWLAMNLARNGEHLELRLDLTAIRELIDDFAREDLWPVIENLIAESAVSFVLGGASHVVGASARQRMESMAQDGLVSSSVIEGAGHWVHSDSPSALRDILVASLRERSP